MVENGVSIYHGNNKQLATNQLRTAIQIRSQIHINICTKIYTLVSTLKPTLILYHHYVFPFSRQKMPTRAYKGELKCKISFFLMKVTH